LIKVEVTQQKCAGTIRVIIEFIENGMVPVKECFRRMGPVILNKCIMTGFRNFEFRDNYDATVNGRKLYGGGASR
jgi:hypothetical protein